MKLAMVITISMLLHISICCLGMEKDQKSIRTNLKLKKEEILELLKSDHSETIALIGDDGKLILGVSSPRGQKLYYYWSPEDRKSISYPQVETMLDSPSSEESSINYIVDHFYDGVNSAPTTPRDNAPSSAKHHEDDFLIPKKKSCCKFCIIS